MAMKTTRSNWRVEVRPVRPTAAAADLGVSPASSKEVCDAVARMIGDRCPEIPARCVEAKCDEERACDRCGQRWMMDKRGLPFLCCVGCGEPGERKRTRSKPAEAMGHPWSPAAHKPAKR